MTWRKPPSANWRTPRKLSCSPRRCSVGSGMVCRSIGREWRRPSSRSTGSQMPSWVRETPAGSRLQRCGARQRHRRVPGSSYCRSISPWLSFQEIARERRNGRSRYTAARAAASTSTSCMRTGWVSGGGLLGCRRRSGLAVAMPPPPPAAVRCMDQKIAEYLGRKEKGMLGGCTHVKVEKSSGD